jgi:hypothetical protein
LKDSANAGFRYTKLVQVKCRPNEITSGNKQKKRENRKNVDGPTTLVVLETAALSEAAASASSTVRGRRPGFL